MLRNLALILLCLLAGACGGDDSRPRVELPEAITWGAMEGADRYTVRAWSGYRLLFEESSTDTSLVLTADMGRALAAFDSVTVEIRGATAGAPDKLLAVETFRLLPAP